MAYTPYDYSALLSPYGYTYSDLGMGKYSMLDPSGASVGTGYKNYDDALADFAWSRGLMTVPEIASVAGEYGGGWTSFIPGRKGGYSHAAFYDPGFRLGWGTEGDYGAKPESWSQIFDTKDALRAALNEGGHLTLDSREKYGRAISDLQRSEELGQFLTNPEKKLITDWTYHRDFGVNDNTPQSITGTNALYGGSTPVFNAQGVLTGYKIDVTPLTGSETHYKNPNAQYAADTSGNTRSSQGLSREYGDLKGSGAVSMGDGNIFVPVDKVDQFAGWVNKDTSSYSHQSSGGLGAIGGLLGAGLGMAVGMPWLGSLAGGVLSDGELGLGDILGAGFGAAGGLNGLLGDAAGAADFFGEGTAGAVADWGAGAAGAGGDMSWLDDILGGAGDFFGEGTAGADVDWSNIFNDTQYAPENVVDLFNNAGTEGFNNLGESWTSLADNLFNNAGMPGYDQYGQAASPWYQSLLQQATDDPLGAAAKTYRALQGSGLLSGGMSLVSGYLGDQAKGDAADKLANAQLEAARIAADAAKFKPVGVTTRFGQSNFTKDAQGNVIGAGYALTPDVKAQQDKLMGMSNDMLTQYQNAPAAFAPMGVAGQRAMELGQGYLATDPAAQAQKYMAEQQALLATGRERDTNQMLTGEFNRGTYGLSTGGTSTGMMGANPRLEALYNAQRQQDLGLAAQATQGGMDYAKFGAGMVGTGGDLVRGMYQGQTAAYDPYKTALGGAQTIENLGQNALDLGVNLGRTTSNAASGAALASGMLSSAQTQANAASSPWADILAGGAKMLAPLQQPQPTQTSSYMFNPYTGVRL